MLTPPSALIPGSKRSSLVLRGATVANPPLGNGRNTLGGATPNHAKRRGSFDSILLAGGKLSEDGVPELPRARDLHTVPGWAPICAAGGETPRRTDSTACECAKLSRAGGLRGTTELQHTYVLTSHKPGIYSPAPNTNATMDTASVCKAIESPIKSHASLVVSPSRHGLRHP